MIRLHILAVQKSQVSMADPISIILLALVDANYCFIAVDVGTVGKSSDSDVFKKSNRKETGIESTGHHREQAIA